MRNLSKNIWMALLALSIASTVLYLLYLLTIDLMLNASKAVYTFAVLPAGIATYFFNKQDLDQGGQSLRKSVGLIGILVAFLVLYIICSWATALMVELFSGTGSSCVGDACDEMRDGWIP